MTKTATIKATGNQKAPFLLIMDGKQYPFDRKQAAERYAKSRFPAILIDDQTLDGSHGRKVES